MNNNLHITAAFNRLQLINEIVEKLASPLNNVKSEDHSLHPWQTIETASVEVHAEGTIEILVKDAVPTRFPFVTSFLFTCLCDAGHSRLNWSVSLS